MRDYGFGDFLHELRLRVGLSQYQLGKLVGVSDKAVSKWENGSSKPQSSILYKLSEVLGVSVDELLCCKYLSAEKKGAEGVFAIKDRLWNKAYEVMQKRYGCNMPIEILNRFLSEKAEMQNSDIIVYFDFLSTLVGEAKKEREHIRVKGETGSSFVAYLLGATEVDPLRPHYYCPDCGKVIFDNSVNDGWDLSKRQCSCTREMIRDGHNIPFENCRHGIFNLSMSKSFLGKAKTIAKEYFKDCTLTFKEREGNRVVTITVSSENSECKLTFFAENELERYKALEQVTATSFDRVYFCQSDILREFQKINTDGITEFKVGFIKNMMQIVSVRSFADLIQIVGLSHGTGTWHDNADKLVGNIPASEVIAYRDDVFNCIQEKLTDKGLTNTGFAYKIMEDTCRGLYAKNGVTEDIKMQLKAIGVEDWFIESIGKIKYLFQKAHGICYVRSALILMWYKIHYPKEFDEIMISDM